MLFTSFDSTLVYIPLFGDAGLAQSVERLTAEWKVEGSIPGAGPFLRVLKYRKIPKISPSMYKPLQIYAPTLNRLFKYKPLGGFYLENCPQIQSKTKEKR